MSIELTIILVVLIIGFAFIAYLLMRVRNTDNLDWAALINTLQQHSREVNERLDRTSSIIALVQKSVGEVSEIGRSMQEIQQLLHAPKLRGSIGEQVLRQLLSQVLPPGSFALQHPFRSGSVVDAAITTKNGMICIDAKFPLSNYRAMVKTNNPSEREGFDKQFVSDVKKHIDDISQKYILPEEGTIDYALMYIPSEAVFYEMVNREHLIEYANKKRVLPVSPITFYAFIKAILMSLEGERINSQAREILVLLRAIKKDYEKVERAASVVTRHVTNSYNALANLAGSIARIGQKIDQTSHLEKSSEQLKIEE